MRTRNQILSLVLTSFALAAPLAHATSASELQQACTLAGETKPNAACLAYQQKAQSASHYGPRGEVNLELSSTWRELRRGRYGTADFPARRLAELVARMTSGSDTQRAAVDFFRADIDAAFDQVRQFFGAKWKDDDGSLSEVEERRHQAARGLPQLVAAVDKFKPVCGVSATIKDWRDGSLLLDKHASPKVAGKQIAKFARPDSGDVVTVYCSGRIDVKMKTGGGYSSPAQLHADAQRISGCVSSCRSEKKTAACQRGDGDMFSESEYACTLSCREQCR